MLVIFTVVISTMVITTMVITTMIIRFVPTARLLFPVLGGPPLDPRGFYPPPFPLYHGFQLPVYDYRWHPAKRVLGGI